ncbi:MAG TPA: assimilatory sulfite reductase (NADPH) flavoprotein subunit [Rhodanobacteraceae bacterium]|nr:assimilatory sulfite reductase (NADPH) flavoprotein subunit [Rhodanobacteraceae bacterium]
MSVASALRRAPLPEDKARLLSNLTDDLDAAGLWWLSGYAAGLAQHHSVPIAPAALVPESAAEADTGARLTIVYGSQTGNAQRVATGLAERARAHGLHVRLFRADAYPLRELKDERLLYVVISTQGYGDPPDDARGFVEFVAGRRAPKLPDLRFAVLGLGDSSYPQFCAVARKLDERLAELGATRLLARGDADLDIDTVAEPWSRRALDEASEALKPRAVLASVTPLRPQAATAAREAEAEVLLNQRITARESAKDVRHVELALEGIEYEPGDALLVTPRNPPVLVDEVLAVLRTNGDGPIAHDGIELPLRTWLGEKLELTRLARPFVIAHAQRARDENLARLLEPEHAEAFSHWLRALQVVDLLQAAPGAWHAQELIAVLRPLAPRAYSIASSRKAVGEEAHLTVARLEYEYAGAIRRGAASQFLCTCAEGERIAVRLQRNERFRLPQDGARDIVMIGPGTGVAPFRGFVQERTAVGARGRNWLFFGNPHFRSDFLYQAEWQAALKSGTLHRLDLAFSRDQAEKIHVQHRVREHGRELYAWLENGAHLYVCGAAAMAHGVEAVLREVLLEHGARTPDAADEYLANLRAQSRYALDVY